MTRNAPTSDRLTADPRLTGALANADGLNIETGAAPSAPPSDGQDGRLVPIKGDTGEPTMRSGDAALVVPVNEFCGPGIYVFAREDVVSFRRVERHPTTWKIWVYVENPVYRDPGQPMEDAEFNAFVAGKVTAVVRVMDPAPLGRAGNDPAVR